MVINAAKTKVLLITTPQKRSHLKDNNLSLHYKDVNLELTTGDKILGVYINENLKWDNHIKPLFGKNIHKFMAFIKNKIIFSIAL